jgi:hypothetical protein
MTLLRMTLLTMTLLRMTLLTMTLLIMTIPSALVTQFVSFLFTFLLLYVKSFISNIHYK